MFDYRKIKNLKKSIESLSIKYEMFFSNRTYKNTHFKSEEEYLVIQKSLSTEIEVEETNVKNFLKEWFKINFENVHFLAFDSRFICITKFIHRIGKVLLKDATDENVKKAIKKCFNDDTDFEMIIECVEDLPEELQKKFTTSI